MATRTDFGRGILHLSAPSVRQDFLRDLAVRHRRPPERRVRNADACRCNRRQLQTGITASDLHDLTCTYLSRARRFSRRSATAKNTATQPTARQRPLNRQQAFLIASLQQRLYGRTVADGPTLRAKMRNLPLTIVFVILTACTGAEWNSINRSFDPTKGDSRLIDAKQRAIISVRRELLDKEGKPINTERKEPVTVLSVCAEPSPDALQATATALAGTEGGEALESYLNLSFSNSETAASIGLRTQAIQLLRDAYFRLCEAYLNDGLDAIAYDVLQRRFQNQIVALLAVEQLTGTVTAAQATLNTSASGNAGAQAGLIAQILKASEDGLVELQEEKDEISQELAKLSEDRKRLNSDAVAAKTAHSENQDQSKAESLKNALDAANDDVARNDLQQMSAKRQIDALDAQIMRAKEHIASLNSAFSEAIKAPITTRATAVGTLGDRRTTSSIHHSQAVVDAVRAITLSAINQDYETQVCFEALRYRNNIHQYKNVVNEVITSDENSSAPGEKFVNYCEKIFDSESKLRFARVKLVDAHASAVKDILEKVGDGSNGISALEAVQLILALSQAAPVEPGTAFLARELKVPSSDAMQDVGNQPDGARNGRSTSHDVKMIDSNRSHLE